MTPTDSSTEAMADSSAEPRPSNFIRDIILEDLKTNKYAGPGADPLSSGA